MPLYSKSGKSGNRICKRKIEWLHLNENHLELSDRNVCTVEWFGNTTLDYSGPKGSDVLLTEREGKCPAHKKSKMPGGGHYGDCPFIVNSRCTTQKDA